ncbi:DUF4270 family protein [Arachidicoccus terrestris]|uniref:DUF4270 family protein n=1 Tax=Arachidicoccus terrestris TaxID=2875539 RepID=UPI001CC5C059|nr:DUF4270 family protein [Arachidicoccus terrestris]UAY56431.1 DUF4270 domain-containing protein [Arachidicoccus terrestris]
MKYKKIWIIAALAIGTIAACTKDITTTLGKDFIPPIDGVNVKDTLIDVFAKTWGEDSASIPITSMNVLGNTVSSVFGHTQATINIQMQPAVDSFSFPVGKDSLTLDSVVLVLSTGGAVYGDSTQPLGFKVYEIDQNAAIGVNNNYPYRTTEQFARAGELTYNDAPVSVIPSMTNDSVKVFGDTTTNQLRLRLKNDFGNKLLKDYTFDHEYKTDSTFLLAFKGFQIVPENKGNALLPIILSGTNTKLAIYYTYINRDGSGKDTTVAYFRPSASSASSNYIQKDRTGTPLEGTLPMGDTTVSDPYLYFEATPGVYSRVKLPDLEKFPASLVYKAELILHGDNDQNDAAGNLLEPPNLFVAAFDSANHRRENLTGDVSPTTLSTGLSYYYATDASSISSLGSYPVKVPDPDQVVDSIYRYQLRITHYVQNVILGKTTNKPLDIYSPGSGDTLYAPSLGQYISIGTSTSSGSLLPLNYPSIGHIRVKGPANSTRKLQLHIVYSPIKE